MRGRRPKNEKAIFLKISGCQCLISLLAGIKIIDMKTTFFQGLALTTLMTITAYCTQAQWGLVVIGKKRLPTLKSVVYCKS
jgi:hypothetical protein